MTNNGPLQRIKFDLPEVFARAIRSRAAVDGCNPRDVLAAAIESYLPKEIDECRQKFAEPARQIKPVVEDRRRKSTR